MTRRLHFGARRFDVGWVSARAGADRRLEGPRATLAVLRRLATEPSNKAALRQLLAASPSTAAVSGWDDDTLLREVARLIAAGHVRLVELPRGPLMARDGVGAESEPPPPSAPSSGPVEAALTWIEIQLVGEDDKPIPGVRYRIELPDGSTREGALDAHGLARVNDIDPGSCVVTFPDLDQDAWTGV